MWWPIRRFRRAVWRAIQHDVLTQSKSAAYSAILGLFPALLIVTTLLALLPESDSLTGEMRSALADLLPGDTVSAVHAYFQTRHVRSVQALLSAVLVSLFGNMGVMTSFMEGFRRAYELPKGGWSFRRERLVALGLIPCCMVPLALTTLLIAFGHQMETWLIANSTHSFQTYVLVLWRLTRWSIGLVTTATVLAVIYHFGIPKPRHWRMVLPGAMGATVLWFMATISYGLYVTRFADYSVVYGPFGTAIATLVWLYITSLSVFIGAELNALVYPMEPEARAEGTDLSEAVRGPGEAGTAAAWSRGTKRKQVRAVPGPSASAAGSEEIGNEEEELAAQQAFRGAERERQSQRVK